MDSEFKGVQSDGLFNNIITSPVITKESHNELKTLNFKENIKIALNEKVVFIHLKFLNLFIKFFNLLSFFVFLQRVPSPIK